MSQIRPLIRRAFDLLRTGGLRAFGVKLVNRIQRIDYGQLFAAGQQTAALPDRSAILFSVIVPLYNTEPDHLTAMIQSVQAQVYVNWQLCLADGSDDDHSYVETIVRRFAASDPRICYMKLDQNRGISGNTNAAIELAMGQFFALLDHDDLLAPEALAEVCAVIFREQADFIYSDETNFISEPTPKNIVLTHYKPDFAPDNLRSNNYICHLSVFAKSLADSVGEFDSDCDGSQDYDYILRLTERARKIVHIPKVLYYWRVHGRSVASDLAAKPYCLDAARLALAKHLDRIGLEGQVENSSILSTYRIRYPIPAEMRVLVLVTIKRMQDLAQLPQLLLTTCGMTVNAVEFVVLISNRLQSDPIRLQGWKNKLSGQVPSCRIVYSEAHEPLPMILNREIHSSTAELIVLLDGGVRRVSENWLLEMAMFAQRPDVGAVGALVTHHGVVREAGLATGVNGSIGAYHDRRVVGEPGYMARLTFVNNVSLVDQTCLMTNRTHFLAAGGFDESFQTAFFDLDLGLRFKKIGLLAVMTPFASVGLSSRQRLTDHLLHKTPARLLADRQRLLSHWANELARPDPYYNPNFKTHHARFDQR